MKGIVIACGLEPEQLERLDQALPDDYMLRVEDIPPILAFEHYKNFNDVLRNLNDILQEAK